MKIAYFDCFAGAAGNMILGSLVDAGLSLDVLASHLQRLPVHGWAFDARRVHKRGLAALALDVNVPGEDSGGHARFGGHRHETVEEHGGGHRHEGIAHRRLAEVVEIVRAARLPEAVQRRAESIFRRLAAAEARVHGSTVDEIVFHEVGQIDAIIDVAGASLGLHLLGIERVYCSPLPCGRGRIQSAHGVTPSPAPATVELLRDCPAYFVDLDAEFVTPTGAAILTSIATFEPWPAMSVQSIGYGAGSSDFPFPNVMRVMIGETVAAKPAASGEEAVVIETNIDDMNPQLFDHVRERIFAAGALDVWTQAVSMKKGRPGTVLSALSPPERENAIVQTILAETTTIGVRSWSVRRTILPRRSETVSTSLGAVRVKVVHAPNGVRVRPEFDDCLEIAEREGLALATVMDRIAREVAQRHQAP
jgi:uncharacterized protein (TIGR00299 family) protein